MKKALNGMCPKLAPQ